MIPNGYWQPIMPVAHDEDISYVLDNGTNEVFSAAPVEAHR